VSRGKNRSSGGRAEFEGMHGSKVYDAFCERPGAWLSWPMSREDRQRMLEALR